MISLTMCARIAPTLMYGIQCHMHVCDTLSVTHINHRSRD